ncbi:hypothetical protein HG530_014367 [Fusarium avenaceum]|nr:hypothetical protein HG530_014367 [Fusarium avenaceum]
MCTYSFQRMVCCCAKGPECPQMARGRAMIGSEAFHFIDMFYAVDDLGSACDYQRRLFGRNAGPTMHCPRYAFDDKRIIKGSYRKSELACVKCAETCAPPSSYFYLLDLMIDPGSIEASPVQEFVGTVEALGNAFSLTIGEIITHRDLCEETDCL